MKLQVVSTGFHGAALSLVRVQERARRRGLPPLLPPFLADSLIVSQCLAESKAVGIAEFLEGAKSWSIAYRSVGSGFGVAVAELDASPELMTQLHATNSDLRFARTFHVGIKFSSRRKYGPMV